jgi:hypothetical protein
VGVSVRGVYSAGGGNRRLTIRGSYCCVDVGDVIRWTWSRDLYRYVLVDVARFVVRETSECIAHRVEPVCIEVLRVCHV